MLWRFPIKDMPTTNNNLQLPVIQKLRHAKFCANACDLPSSTAVIRHNHETAGFPVKKTWCKVITNRNYNTWTGLTVELARRCFPDADETIIGTMSQKKKNIRSTKMKNIEKKRLP